MKEIPVDPALEYGMIRGMLEVYDDPYTVFLEPQQHELMSQSLEGKFGGIGAEISMDEGGNWTMFPFPDNPAEKAGIQNGDRLLEIDDSMVTSEWTSAQIQEAIRGPIGEKVKLVIGKAPDFSPIEKTIRRAEIQLPSITWRLDVGSPWIGIITINLMAATTNDEILVAVEKLKTQKATHFILDLRDNPGGYLSAGIEIARLFMSEGVIMEQQYPNKEVQQFKVTQRGELADLPVVLLINRNSASASEIAAGAMQINGRAILVGEPSYGKDTIQLIFDLEDGSSIRVTAAKWWIPGIENSIEGFSLQPDILVIQNEDKSTDDILKAALVYWQEQVVQE
jgi:carboxyl-terminal processing protease